MTSLGDRDLRSTLLCTCLKSRQCVAFSRRTAFDKDHNIQEKMDACDWRGDNASNRITMNMMSTRLSLGRMGKLLDMYLTYCQKYLGEWEIRH